MRGAYARQFVALSLGGDAELIALCVVEGDPRVIPDADVVATLVVDVGGRRGATRIPDERIAHRLIVIVGVDDKLVNESWIAGRLLVDPRRVFQENLRERG